MSSFDVRVFAIRRRPGRTAFEVRWRVAGRDKSRSFMTWVCVPRISSAALTSGVALPAAQP
jgi:hypothetical protein